MKSNYHKLILLAFVTVCLFSPAAAQDWSWYLNHDFLNPSGINPPRNNSPFLFDIDNDNDLDLILGQGDGTIALYYNDGFPEVERWRLDEDYFAGLSFDHCVIPSLGDFDGDDSLELVVGITDYGFPEDSLHVFRNRGTSENPVWEEVFGFFNISTAEFAFHKFHDWDNDGDYDLIVSAVGVIEDPYYFYRNEGIPGEPAWYLDSTLTDALPSGITPCGYEGFDIADLNSDGAYDFVSAYIECDSYSALAFIINEGTNENPVYGIPIINQTPYLGYQITPVMEDIDNDGDFDVLAAGAYPLVIYLQNNGDPQSPSFDGDGNVTLGPFYIDGAEDMAFFDRDNDSDLDFALFYSYWLNPVGYHHISWTAFINSGTPTMPDFMHMDWFGWGYSYYTDMAWTHGDLNSDGWHDLVCNFHGYLKTFWNISDSEFEVDDNVFSDIEIGVRHPELVDLDSDGDLDLFVIDTASNELTAFENTGTPQESHWQQNHEWVEDLDLSASFVRTIFLNGDNLPDLILQVGGQLKGYLNVGSQADPAFQYIPQIFEDWQDYPVSYFDIADLDGDGDDDIVLNEGGVILFLENQNVLAIDDVELPANSFTLSNYPNPFNASTTISFGLREAENINLAVYDIVGRLVKTLIDEKMDAGEHSIIWDGEDTAGKSVASGIYFYSINIDNKVFSNRMLLLK